MPDASLPLPVARLRRRALHAKSGKDGHDSAWFALEVSIRLGVAAAPPPDPSSLARASIGQWAATLAGPAGKLTDPRFAALTDLQREILGQAPSRPEGVTSRRLLSSLVAYRNAVLAHGSSRAARFYERARDVLLGVLDAAWEAHLVLPTGGRLVWVDGIEESPGGARLARVFELQGDVPALLDRDGTPVPEGVHARRLYLRTDDAWKSLHPWATFDEDDERLYCFNGLGRSVRFLDYGSGEVLTGERLRSVSPGIEEDLRRVLVPEDATGGSEAAPATVDGPPPQDDAAEFEVLGPLGGGSTGEVVLARQRSVDRLVVVKTLAPALALDVTGRARFRREVRSLGRADHPNVAKIISAGERSGRPYFVMEHVRGVDLQRVLDHLPTATGLTDALARALRELHEERPGLADWLAAPPGEASSGPAVDDPARIASLVSELAAALDHLHQRGIVHRDVKPANLMVTWPEQRPVLLDLGLAALDDASRSLTLDAAREAGGKDGGLQRLRYCAPEQFRVGIDALDGRVDVYSLAAVAYELIARRPLFGDAASGRPVDQVLFEEPIPLRRIAPATPHWLAHAVHRALEKNPARRWPDAAAFAAALATGGRRGGWLARLTGRSRSR